MLANQTRAERGPRKPPKPDSDYVVLWAMQRDGVHVRVYVCAFVGEPPVPFNISQLPDQPQLPSPSSPTRWGITSRFPGTASVLQQGLPVSP